MEQTTGSSKDKPSWQAWEEAAADESRWRNHQERGLLKVQYLEGFILRIWFEEELDVTIYELDFEPLFLEDNPGGVYAVLADRDRFSQARGDYALVWLDPESGVYDSKTIDIAPECIRFFCERYGTLIKAPGELARPSVNDLSRIHS